MEIKTPIEFRPLPNYPTYPPYHTGLYLEDYFINYWKENNFITERKFIPIGWTSYYNNNLDRTLLQTYLNFLPKNDKYFVVSQHDDAPTETLPPNTLIFSAGGNVINENVIPIPLICSSLNHKTLINSKDIFCSFVGSTTHYIRSILYNTYKDKYYFSQSDWSPSISTDKFEHFKHILSRSKFSLCPRGYGASSFRLYEVMQFNTIPVYVSDRHYLPWTDELNWNEFCVLVNLNEIGDLDEILKSISDDKYHKMINKMNEVFTNYFTLEGVCKQIKKRVIQ